MTIVVLFPSITVGEEDLNTFSGARVFQKNFLRMRLHFTESDLPDWWSQVCSYKRPRVCVFIVVNVCCSHLPNMLTFLILIRLGYVGIVLNDIKNLFKNQEILQKSITNRKFKLTLHVIYVSLQHLTLSQQINFINTEKWQWQIYRYWGFIVAVHQLGLCFLNV